MRHLTSILRFGTAGLALVFGACMTGNDKNESTGTIDPAVMGQSLASGFAFTGAWQQTVANPTSAVPLPSSAPASSKAATALTKRAALAKYTRAGDTVWAVDSTSKPGYATVSMVAQNTPGLLQTTYDTVELVYDDKAHDSIKDNEDVVRMSHTVTGLLGTLDRVEIADADGDNLINVVSGRTNKARASFTHQVAATVEKATVVVGPGPDGDYDSTAEADNLVYEAKWTKTVNGQLKASATFSDDDNDGVIVDNAAVSPVRLDLVEYHPVDRPWVDSVHATARAKYLGYGQGDMPVSFHYTEYLLNGRVNELYFKNSKGTEDLIADDTMHAFLETRVQNQDDTLASAKLEILFNPGSDLKSESDDLFYGMNVETHKRFGWERDAEFHFTAGAPVPHGQNATSGSFSAKVTFANGKSATLSGNFTPDGYTATYTGPDGQTVTVTYDKNGKPKAA